MPERKGENRVKVLKNNRRKFNGERQGNNPLIEVR